MEFNVNHNSIADKENLLQAMIEVAKANNLYIERPEVFKANPELFCKILVYIS